MWATTAVSIDQCTFVFNPPPANPGDVHLVVGDAGKPSTYELPSNGGQNWSMAADGKSATLAGATCAKAKSGGYASLEFIFGCPDNFIH